MKKNEMVQLHAEKREVTKKAVEELIVGIDELIETVKNGLEVGDKVKIGQYFTVEKVHKEDKVGEMTRVIDGQKVKQSYTTPAHDELVIKRTSVLKSI